MSEEEKNKDGDMTVEISKDEIETIMQENRLDPKKKEIKPEVQVKVARTFPESMSTTIGELAGAMAKAQGAMVNALKDKQGYGYKYATLPNLTDIVRAPYSENGIAIVQTHELIKNKNGSVVTHTTIIHSSGEWFKSSIEVVMTPMKNLSFAQSEGVAMTYGRRYALQSISLIAAEEDTDGA